MTKHRKKILRAAWTTVAVLGGIALVLGYLLFRKVYTPNTRAANDPYIYIATGSDIFDVVEILNAKKLIIDEKSFMWTSKQMKYDDNVKPGRYRITPGMNNKKLVSLLRSGKQEPVKLIFNNIRTKEQLAERVASQIEAEKASILNLLGDEDYVNELGFSTENVLSMFIPDTYEFYWNTSSDKFIRRMHAEYNKFWTADKKKKAEAAGLTPVQVSIVASIVQMESNIEEEKPVIAGVYMNRYRKNWKLEADPTLVYALGDFTIRRVLNAYKTIDSPYNTYLYKGLPPGPICLPTKSSINSVLNYTEHNYMYFCAKDDFSGYHSFASTYDKHLLNARRFQRAMDKRGIKS